MRLSTARFFSVLCALLVISAAICGAPVRAGSPRRSSSHGTPTPNPPIVIGFSVISASRGAAILRSVYPNARITVDAHANAVIVVASGYDEQGMRTIAGGIDVKNPTDTQVDTYQPKVLSPSTVASRLAGVFPSTRVLPAPNKTIIIMASPSEMGQVKSVITAIDTAPPTPSPKPRYPAYDDDSRPPRR